MTNNVDRIPVFQKQSSGMALSCEAQKEYEICDCEEWVRWLVMKVEQDKYRNCILKPFESLALQSTAIIAFHLMTIIISISIVKDINNYHIEKLEILNNFSLKLSLRWFEFHSLQKKNLFTIGKI